MAFVYATMAIQLELAGAGAGWTTLAAKDVRGQEPITCQYGIQGNTPNDRVANAGKLAFALNNSEFNSAGLLGYYSNLHASRRSGFAPNIGVRLAISCPDVASGTLYYKFRGVLDDAVPDPGAYGPRMTHCVAVDWFNDAADIDEPDLPVQINKRMDEVITSMLDALTTQPPARYIETGLETYAYSLDGGSGGRGQRLKVRERISQLVKSELGYCYQKGDTVQGGTLMVENRHHRAANPTVLFTFSNDMDRDGIVVPGSRSDVFRKVHVFVHPTNDVSAASTIVLFSVQQAQILIQPGDTNDTIFGAYFDPTTKEQIGGTSTIDPVITTDYLMNAAADGGGVNLSADFTVTASRTGLGVRFTVTNNGATAGYVTKLQVRGKPIYRFDAVVEVEVAGAFGDQVLELEMACQNSVNVAKDVGDFLSSILSTLFAAVKSIRFNANRSAALMAAALQREPGDRIAITETVTGLAANQFTINSVELECQRGGLLWCKWGLEPASSQQFWLWGIAGSSEWGTTTVYGF